MFLINPVSVGFTLEGVNGTVGTAYTGQIDLTQTKGGSNHLHLPVSFTPSDASSAPLVTVTSSCSPSTIAVKDQTTCTAQVQNNAFEPATVNATMSSTSGLKLVSSPTGVRVGQNMTFGPVNLAAATPPKPLSLQVRARSGASLSRRSASRCARSVTSRS